MNITKKASIGSGTKYSIMKETIVLLFAISIACTAFSQSKKDSVHKAPLKEQVKKDSVNAGAGITDINAVPLFSIYEIQQLDQQLFSEIPAKYVDALRAWFREKIAQKLTPKKE